MSHQPVTTYLTAVRLVPLAERIADRLDPLHVRVASQLRRAAGSMLSRAHGGLELRSRRAVPSPAGRRSVRPPSVPIWWRPAWI